MAICLLSKPDFWSYLGVTRTLNLTYLNAMPEGMKVLFKCELVNIGKRMAFIRCDVLEEGTGKVMVTCEHGKVNIDAKI